MTSSPTKPQETVKDGKALFLQWSCNYYKWEDLSNLEWECWRHLSLALDDEREKVDELRNKNTELERTLSTHPDSALLGRIVSVMGMALKQLRSCDDGNDVWHGETISDTCLRITQLLADLGGQQP